MTVAPPSSVIHPVDEPVALMQLEMLGSDHFRGRSASLGTRVVYGGQVLGQALAAASRTVPADRPVHSLHAYFLLPGEFAPIEYMVERERDGRSFTTRHVVARQSGRTIFEMSASFHVREEGFEHQLPMPSVLAPESLVSALELRQAQADRLPEHWRTKVFLEQQGFEFRPVEAMNWIAPERRPAEAQTWMRLTSPLPDDPLIHRALLVYISDYGLLSAAGLPHGVSILSDNVFAASLDHAMWFHRDFRVDDWLLYCVDSPNAGGACGLCRGSLYTRDGRLVASTMQEGLIRTT